MAKEDGFDIPTGFSNSVFKSDSALKFSIIASYQQTFTSKKLSSSFIGRPE